MYVVLRNLEHMYVVLRKRFSSFSYVVLRKRFSSFSKNSEAGASEFLENLGRNVSCGRVRVLCHINSSYYQDYCLSDNVII